MPPITLALAAVASGLLLGFGGVGIVAVGLIVLGAGLVHLIDRRFGPAVLGIALGCAVAGFCRTMDQRCIAAALQTGQARVRLTTALGSGRLAFGTMEQGACAPRVMLVGRSASEPAGSLLLVRGRGKITPGGLEFLEPRVVRLRGPGVLDRVRASTGRVLDDLYGSRSPLARALVIADDRQIDRNIRDEFADAGIVHMLSVSGLHVAILAQGVALLFGLVRLSTRHVHIATIVTVIGYVAMIGAPSPAVRSAVMLIGVRGAQLRQRPTSDWAALALGALLPLWNPREITGIGYQLSVAGMTALLASGRLFRRFSLRGRFAGVWRELGTTVIATLVTAPIVSAAFGRLSVIAPASNLAVGPLFGLLQPALFLSILFSPITPVAQLFADGASLLMDVVGRVAALAAHVPGAVMQVAPGPVTALLLAASAMGFVVACCSRYWVRTGTLVALALASAAWVPLVPRLGGALEVHVIDVGQGDAIALRTPLGRWVLVDAGPLWQTGDAGASKVVPYLRQRGGELVLVAVTHPHADHVGGLASVLTRVPAPEFWDAARVFGSDGYLGALRAARTKGTTWVRVRPGLEKAIDGVTVQVLAPDSVWTATQTDPNTSSIVLLVTFGRRRFLLTGDAERAEEGWLLSRYADLHADVLKVAHHGSATSSSDEFLDAVRPAMAVISLGAENRYGHPSPEVLRRFDERRIDVLRTDYDGTIVLRTDGDNLWISARGESWRLGR